MKINNTAFGRVQNKALQAGVGEALDAVVKKVDDVDSRMLNYMGDWVTGNEYLENDVVTWATDGHLYEVIKAHTSSATFDPDNPEYYKAMTATKLRKYTVSNATNETQLKALAKFVHDNLGKIAVIYGILSDGSCITLSYYSYMSGSTPGIVLTSTPRIIGGSKEIQIRQLGQSTYNFNRWISLTGQDDNSVTFVDNGQSGFTSIEVYYL